MTKSLGTGVIATAIKKNVARESWIDGAVKSMTTLNKTAAEVIHRFVETKEIHNPSSEAHDSRPATRDDSPVHALTDITGFGLIGHLREMLLASDKVSAVVRANHIPLLEGALECVRDGHIPAGLKANREFAECTVHYAGSVADDLKTILFDPQTAGGLLVAAAPEIAPDLLSALRAKAVPAAEIGEIQERGEHLIRVVT
jgi:selenide,water dikinase